MIITNSNLKDKNCTRVKVNLGTIFLFENYVVTNFDEGVDINYDNYYEVGMLMKDYFKDRPFGYIANRSHSYSIDLTDAHVFNEEFPNLKAYAVVAYNTLTERVFEIENHFFKSERNTFKTIEEAVEWVNQVISESN
ncbi:hypothetical protein [Winogradskyella tangerina]|uniref:hypothetical protein n=1 Tax=Winogradskyella tangerina TaxID=2023240 RepID=UPI000DBE142E|nr:hypothetical protein [Winogradskyella tangerina]